MAVASPETLPVGTRVEVARSEGGWSAAVIVSVDDSSAQARIEGIGKGKSIHWGQKQNFWRFPAGEDQTAAKQDEAHGDLIAKFLTNNTEDNGEEEMNIDEEPDMHTHENEGEAEKEGEAENEEWGLDVSWEDEDGQEAKEAKDGSLDDRVNQGISELFEEYRMSGDGEEVDEENAADNDAEASEGVADDHLLEAPNTPEEDAKESGEEGLSVFEQAEEEAKDEHQTTEASSDEVKKPVAKIRPVAKFRVKAHPPPPEPPPPVKLTRPKAPLHSLQGRPPTTPVNPPPAPVQPQVAPNMPSVPAVRPPPQHVRGPHVRGPALVRGPVSKATHFNNNTDTVASTGAASATQWAQSAAEKVAAAAKQFNQLTPGEKIATATALAANLAQVNAANVAANAASVAAKGPKMQTRPIGAPIGAPFPKGGPAPAAAPFPKGGGNPGAPFPKGATSSATAPFPKVGSSPAKAPFPKGGAVPPPPPPLAVAAQNAPGANGVLDAALKIAVEAFASKKKLSEEWITKVSKLEPAKIRKIIAAPDSANIDAVTDIFASHEIPKDGKKPPRQPNTPPPGVVRDASSLVPGSSRPPEPPQKAPRPKGRPSGPEPPWKPPPSTLLAGNSSASSATSTPAQSSSANADSGALSSDELEQEASRRLEENPFTQKDLQIIDRLKEQTGLGDEVTIGLRFLRKEDFRKLMFQDNLEKKLQEAPETDRSQLALTMIGQVDPSAESLVRQLLRVDGLEPEEPEPEQEAGQVADDQASGRVTISLRPGRLGLEYDGGRVSKVHPNGQAAQMGVQPGWQLVKINDQNCNMFDSPLFKEASQNSNLPYKAVFEKASKAVEAAWTPGKGKGSEVAPPLGKGKGLAGKGIEVTPASGKGAKPGKVVPPPPGKKVTLNTQNDTGVASAEEKAEDANVTLTFNAVCLAKIVGRHGTNIRDIREQSGADILVRGGKETIGKGGKMCEVIIKGAADAVDYAKKGVIELAGEGPIPATANPTQPTQVIPAQVTQVEKGKGGILQSQQGNDQTELKISVDDVALQTVLGKGGATLRIVREQSGAAIQLKPTFQEDSKGGKTKKAFDVTINGTKAQAEHAKKLIENLAASALQKIKTPIQPPSNTPASSSQSVPDRGVGSGHVENTADDESAARAKRAKGTVNEAGIVVKARSRSPRRITPKIGAAASTAKESEIKADPLKDWLQGLDESGDMLRYLDLLRKNFSSLAQLTHVLADTPENGKTVLSCIEPDFFEVLQVESLGHKLALAKAIIALGKPK